MKDVDAVLRRVSQLRQLWAWRDTEKELIRAICSSPREGLRAVLGDLSNVNPYSVPAANLVLSGLTRLGQKIGRVPDLRVDPPTGDEKERVRKSAEKRARIVTAKDEADNLEGMLNQTGLWLPGYTFTAWVVKEKRTDDGEPYGGAMILDPYGTYPAHSAFGEQPQDLAYVYRMSARDLVERYPQHRVKLVGTQQSGGGVLLDSSAYPQAGPMFGGNSSSWSSPSGSGLEVAEYYDRDGCWVVVPEKRLLLEHYPNPLSTPQFHVYSKYSFDKPVGQYDHVIGLQTQIARFNALALIAMEDSVFTETNVFGELISGQYRKGRHSVNYFTPGTQVNKPPTQIPYQLFQELDRLERQFRITAGYAVTDDAVSPAAQATGQGIDRLTAGIDMEVKQYLGILRRGLQAVDRKRLEWDDACYPNRTLSIAGARRGTPFEETYTPAKDIKGQYRTVRNYGAMAGLDDQNKISALLLLKQGDLLDSQSAMEELDLGGRSVTQVQDRIEDEKVRRTLMEMMASGQPVDPRVAMTLIEMLPESEMKERFKKYWTPEPPEMSAEEEAMVGAPPQGPPDLMAMLGMGAPPEQGALPAGGPPAGMPALPAGAVA